MSLPRFRRPRARRLAGALLALSCALPASAHAGDQPPFTSYPDGAITIGDVNGDGRLDFGGYVSGETLYTWTYEIAYGTPGAGPAQWPADGGPGLSIRNTGSLPTGARVGDFDGDGYDDVGLFGGLYHSWVVFGGPGNGVVELTTAGSERVMSVRHTDQTGLAGSGGIGDFDGDGLEDFIFQPMAAGPLGNDKLWGNATIVYGRQQRQAFVNLDVADPGLSKINGSRRCGWTTRNNLLPWWECTTALVRPLDPVGDVDGDGKADLYHPAGKALIRGRAGRMVIAAATRDANTISLASRPSGTPWTGGTSPDPEPEPDPGNGGTAGWTLSGAAARGAGDSVVLTQGIQSNVAGAVYDARSTIDARKVTVEFDVRISPVVGSGQGVTVAFAAPSSGGQAIAKNAGIGLGWVGNKGNAIVLGTVKAGPAPSNNYVAIASDVVGRSGYPTLVQSAAAGSSLARATNRVRVVSSGGVVTVIVNGVERLRRTIMLPAAAYVGFTASTSNNQRSDHVISNVRVTTG